MGKRALLVLLTIVLSSMLLFACGNPKSEMSANAVRPITDFKGHQVDIPASPQRVIFWGETYGDLLAIDADVVGAGFFAIDGFVFEDQVKNVEDLGFPINLEKALELEPDLIITASTDEKEYEQLSKIAPTVMFNTFEKLDARMLLIGDLVGRKAEAEQWLAQYKEKTDQMWATLHKAGVQSDETASVLTFYPGDRLFVMASTGLSQVIYEQGGLKPLGKVQELLDEGTGFKEISKELLPEYAGDRIFVLTPVDEEAKKSTEDMLASPLWKNLPAVQKGHVYTIDILKSGSDALTRQWLLEEIPNQLAK
ncbi:ABC transporter substrate-binding protein [Paenibacillus lutimineralis]|uniref:Ferrichrome ABC transporter substrate-binding protein n=1 Tax=Paenibacillus lutimineralis TaxID=2707005 RepID=A0A3S9V4U7_9BACL|nr:ABC transporter substrate-binding protein [Paenibacillus lutimineralis]AZS17571.1 ferrichrome ABC transporter substrate-binding protein [Paenibacillus lutimineralis]